MTSAKLYINAHPSLCPFIPSMPHCSRISELTRIAPLCDEKVFLHGKRSHQLSLENERKNKRRRVENGDSSLKPLRKSGQGQRRKKASRNQSAVLMKSPIQRTVTVEIKNSIIKRKITPLPKEGMVKQKKKSDFGRMVVEIPKINTKIKEQHEVIEKYPMLDTNTKPLQSLENEFNESAIGYPVRSIKRKAPQLEFGGHHLRKRVFQDPTEKMVQKGSHPRQSSKSSIEVKRPLLKKKNLKSDVGELAIKVSKTSGKLEQPVERNRIVDADTIRRSLRVLKARGQHCENSPGVRSSKRPFSQFPEVEVDKCTLKPQKRARHCQTPATEINVNRTTRKCRPKSSEKNEQKLTRIKRDVQSKAQGNKGEDLPGGRLGFLRPSEKNEHKLTRIKRDVQSKADIVQLPNIETTRLKQFRKLNTIQSDKGEDIPGGRLGLRKSTRHLQSAVQVDARSIETSKTVNLKTKLSVPTSDANAWERRRINNSKTAIKNNEEIRTQTTHSSPIFSTRESELDPTARNLKFSIEKENYPMEQLTSAQTDMKALERCTINNSKTAIKNNEEIRTLSADSKSELDSTALNLKDSPSKFPIDKKNCPMEQRTPTKSEMKAVASTQIECEEVSDGLEFPFGERSFVIFDDELCEGFQLDISPIPGRCWDWLDV